MIDIDPGSERTQADIEADEFFARFDGDNDEPEEAVADDDADTDTPSEGGEQR